MTAFAQTTSLSETLLLIPGGVAVLGAVFSAILTPFGLYYLGTGSVSKSKKASFSKISPLTFLGLSVITLGLYLYFWQIRNWAELKKSHSELNLPLYGFGTFIPLLNIYLTLRQFEYINSTFKKPYSVTNLCFGYFASSLFGLQILSYLFVQRKINGKSFTTVELSILLLLSLVVGILHTIYLFLDFGY